MVAESEKSNQFMLAVFSKSVVLRTKEPLNKSDVKCKYIADVIRFSVHFDWSTVTLHLRSPLGSPLLPNFLYNFWLSYEW